MTLYWQELHNDLLNSLLGGFRAHTGIMNAPSATRYTLEQIRDFIRCHLARIAPQECGFSLLEFDSPLLTSKSCDLSCD